MIVGSTQKAITTVKLQLMAKYDCKDLGALDKLLNMEVVRTKEGGLFLSRYLYIQDALGRFKPHLPGLGYIKTGVFTCGSSPRKRILKAAQRSVEVTFPKER